VRECIGDSRTTSRTERRAMARQTASVSTGRARCASRVLHACPASLLGDSLKSAIILAKNLFYCTARYSRLSWHSTTPTRTPTPTRTSSPTSARGSSRGCRRIRRLPCSACNRKNFVLHEPDTHEDPRRLVRHARFSSRGCPLGMHACTRVDVYCT